MKSLKELFLILLFALAARIFWMFLIPHVEAPDENTHFWVVQFIVNNFCLPNYHAVIAGGPVAVYGAIPQFGYLTHILFLKTIGLFFTANKWLYIARFGSILMGLVVIAVSHQIGKLLFSNNRLAALALPLIITFHPQFVFVTSYINNDATTAALSSIILLLLVYALQKGLTLANIISLSVCCSWLILSKYSGYCVLFTTLLALLFVLYRQRDKLRTQLILIVLMTLTLICLTSWWFVRNYFEFNGDITGIKTMHHIWTLTYHRYVESFASPIAVVLSTRFWRMLFFSFWGWFGYMTHELPRAIYYIYMAFMVLSFSTFLKSDFRDNFNWSWFVLVICLLVNLLFCIFGTYIGIVGPQGRYLFPSEIPIMAVFVAGLNSAPKQISRYLLVSLIVFNLTAYIYASFYLFRLYS